MFNTKEDFLLDTINHYNSLNRAIVPVSGELGAVSCVYHPTETSKGCAIGRHLPLKVSSNSNLQSASVNRDIVFNLLPKWMQNLGRTYLAYVQRLHDLPENWDEFGLSDSGKLRVNGIIITFKLNLPLYNLN